MNRFRIALIGAALYALVSVMPAWAVWEGNAGIAAETEFPSVGYFAKSDMFPKNTLVEIVNLETEITIRVIVTGSSGVPGLVAMLSPEAAAALNVKSGSVSRVRISVPSPVTETPALGTIPGGSGTKTSDPDVNPETAALEADVIAGTASRMGDTGSGNTAETLAESETEPDLPLAAIAEPSSDPLVPLSVNEENPIAHADAPEIPVDAPPVSDAYYDEPELHATEPDAAEEPELTLVPTVVDSLPVPQADTFSGELLAEPELTMGETEEQPIDILADTESAAQTPEEVAEVVEITEVAEIVEAPEQEFPVETETLVTLEPAEPLPPPVSELTETLPAPAMVVEEPRLPVAPLVTENVPELPYVSRFEMGKYYVQIASYSDISNVTRLIDQWGKKYPIAVERAIANDRTTLKVYVGPVNRDEYGAVLERFRIAGFRDAFVKQAK